MHRFSTAFIALLAVCVGAAPLVRAQTSPPPPGIDLVRQGWSATQRGYWYDTSQGSRLIPRVWLEALEQPDSDGLFLDNRFIASFRYLPRQGALPVGFAVDRRDDDRNLTAVSRLRWRERQGNSEPWVGFTCSACHTAEITFRGTSMRIDGGPTMADFQGFFAAFDTALVRTRDDPASFDRFAARVLRGVDTTRNRQMLREALARLVDHRLRLAALNQTSMRYGFGRVDAIGHIFNKVAYVARPDDPTRNEPDAPVSYPYMWNVPQHGRVQWNGLVENLPIRINGEVVDPGALGRNIGEAIGVFSDIRPRGLIEFGPTSSVNVRNLNGLERQLDTLLPPRWPSEVFGEPNRELARVGRDLFERDCASCHIQIRRDDLTTRVIERMDLFTPETFDTATTDIWMACNTTLNTANTGALRGERPLLFAGGALGREAPVSAMLSVLVAQTTIRNREDALSPPERAEAERAMEGYPEYSRPMISLGEQEIIVTSSSGAAESDWTSQVRDPGSYSRDERRERCREALDPTDNTPEARERRRYLGYKSRPLNGVWATAPYLHNGSVVSLYELLLPPAQRRASFYTGSREFDPVNVGFVPDPSPNNTFQFVARDAAGRRVEGNSNGGHDYGNARLSHDERMAIIEYLKVIGE